MRYLCLPLAISLLLLSGAGYAAGSTEINRLPGSAVHGAGGNENSDLLARGKYLATAADCGACHTSPRQGAPMAGGYAIQSPMGSIYASNITPSKTAGIGLWSEAEFVRAVRKGINRQGEHLYPAMPYTAYARITDDDMHALYFYFMQGVTPSDTPTPRTRLPFPFSFRSAMALWNALFAREPQARSTPATRGEYLVNALAHCDTCHTPRNMLMGQQNDRALAGGSLGSWYAPNITPDPQSGIGSWTAAELTRYLKTGRVPGKAQAAGPMAEVVEHSLQYLSDADIAAMVAWLRQLPPVDNGEVTARESLGGPSASEARLRGQQEADSGWQVFSASCASCHQPDGSGNARYPSLFHNSATGASRPDNLIATILFGVQRNVQGESVAMPAFGPDADFAMRLSDQQIADVSRYVMKNFGNPQVNVTAEQVAGLRRGGATPLLVRLTQPGVLAGAALAVVLLAAALIIRRRRRDV